MEHGEPFELAVFHRFDVALRYAAEIAASYARNDYDRIRRGVPCSGTRAIIVGWDVWEIRHDSPTPIVHAVPARIPGERTLKVALTMLD